MSGMSVNQQTGRLRLRAMLDCVDGPLKQSLLNNNPLHLPKLIIPSKLIILSCLRATPIESMLTEINLSPKIDRIHTLSVYFGTQLMTICPIPTANFTVNWQGSW